MTPKTLGILALVAAAVLAVAFWIARGRAPSETAAPPAIKTEKAGELGAPSAAGARLLPVLGAKANDVAEISVKGAEKEAQVRRDGGRWVVPAQGGYPADPDKVRDAVLSIAEMTIAEPKTQKPENYALLGVQEPGEKDSTSRLVTLKDAQGAVVASLIVGNSAPGGARTTPGANVYVRRAGEAQAFEARTRIDPRYALDPDPGTWIKKSLDGVPADRIKSISISHADGAAVELAKPQKSDPEFIIANLPAGREIKYAGAASAVAQAVALVTFDSVKPVADIAAGATPTGTAIFRTFDGLVLTVDTSTRDGTSWVTFDARYEAPPEAPATEPTPSDQPPPAANKPADEVRKEVEALNARFGGWAFALPSYRVQQLLTKMEDLLKPAEAAASPSGTTPGPITGDDGEPVELPDK